MYSSDLKNEKEIAIVAACRNPEFKITPGKQVLAVDPHYYRPTEVDLLVGDPTKAQQKLGWKPQYDLGALVTEMVDADVELFRKEKLLKDSGYSIRNQFE